MGHVYDTGLDKPQRTLIRSAIIERLSSLLTTANPPRYVATIKPLPRALRGEGDEDGLAMLTAMVSGAAPAILVALGRKRYQTGADPLETLGTLEAVVYVASGHASDIVYGRLSGDAVSVANLSADPGIETMLEHVEELLLGQPLALAGVKELRPIDEDEVATFADFSLWELRFEVEVERVINPNRNAAQLVLSIQGEHQEDGTSDLAPGESDIAPLVTIATLAPESP